MAQDVFISYSSRDKPIADAICANLEANSIRCWIAPRDIAPGEDWPTAIARAISHSRVMVLVFSAFSNSSEDVSRELMLAAKNKLVIIPFKIENIEPEPGKEYYLARTHWLDAINPPTQEQIQELINCVKALVPLKEPIIMGNQTITTLPLGTTAKVVHPRWLLFMYVAIGVVLVGILGWAGYNLLIKIPASPIQPTPFLTNVPSTFATTAIIQNPTPISEPVVLYSDDFSNSQSGWNQSSGTAMQFKYSNGKYVISQPQGDYIGWSCGGLNFTDAVLTVDALLVAGTDNITGPLVIWRYVDDNNFYVLQMGYSKLFVGKLADNQWKTLYDSSPRNAVKSGQQINRIAISYAGGTSTIYINDIEVTSIQDSTFTAGDICLGTFGSATSAVEVSYDNLAVYSVDSWTPPK